MVWKIHSPIWKIQHITDYKKITTTHLQIFYLFYKQTDFYFAANNPFLRCTF